MNASPRPVDDYLLLSKSVPVIPRYGTKCAPSSCGRRGLKNRQKPLRVIFLPSLACRDRSQIIDLDRRSGHRSCTCTVNPKNFFVVVVGVSAVLHFTSFPFSFFSPDSSVAQTPKNVEPLDCKFRLLRRRSLGGKISVSEVMHLLTLNVFPVNFRVVFVVAFFSFSFFFIHFLSYFLFFFLFSVVTSNFFFFPVEIVSESTLIETSFARQSISSLPSRPRALTTPWVRKLEFSVSTVFKAFKDGVDRAKACLVPLKKKPELEGCLQT